jgi:hypothetical protein
MSTTRMLNRASLCLLGSLLLQGCDGTAQDQTMAASPATPSAISSVADFCDGASTSGSWLENADFCDDFSDGTDSRWETRGGLWEVINHEYVGTGVPDACATGASADETLIRDLRAENVEMRLEMRSQQRVDKGIILRSTGFGDQIALNFRADPFNDLVVQELAGCQFILFDSSTRIPHLVGQTIDVQIKLVGDHLMVWIDGQVVLDRNFPFRARPGAMGLVVIDEGVTAFDNVQVALLDEPPC